MPSRTDGRRDGREGGKGMDAITLLKAHHAKVKKLLKEMEEAEEADEREELLQTIEQELTVHTKIEEEIFYPAFREAAEKDEDQKLYLEALEEHHVVDLVLPEIKETDTESGEFAAKAKVLKDLVEHHIEEEEEDMFPRARKLMERDELKRLGERLEERKGALAG